MIYTDKREFTSRYAKYGILVVLVCSFVIGFWSGNKSEKPNTFDSSALMNPMYDYGLDNTLNNSDFVGMVEIIDKEYPHPNRNDTIILAKPIESYMGVIEYDEILIPTNGGYLLENGEEYLIFLDKFDLFSMPDNTYSLGHSSSIFDVTAFGKIKSMAKVADKTIEDVDTITELKEYIIKMPSAYNISDESVPDDFDNVSELIVFADRIAKIRIKSVEDVTNVLFVAKYDIVNLYKGESWSANEGNFLPKTVDELEVGKEYIIFFTEDEDGILFPATRNDSLLDESNIRFAEVEQYFE